MKSYALMLFAFGAGCSCDATVGVGSGDAAGDGQVDVLTDTLMDASLDGTINAPVIDGLRALRLDPGSLDLVDDGVAPGERGRFRAIGTFDDGDRDVSDEVVWVITDSRLATLAGGEVETQGIGGSTEVIAVAGAVSASGELNVRVEVVVVVGETSPGAPALFPADPSEDELLDGPDIMYPSHETRFPRNLLRVNHQWNGDADLYELRFESEWALIRFFTTERAYQPNADEWRLIAETHAGSSLSLRVRGREADGTIRSSIPITLSYSEAEVLGALYYWSTGAQGVMRATIASPLATKFYSDPESDDNRCVACHTVARNGRRMAFGYGGERLRQISVPERELQIPSDPEEDGPSYGWGTFDPGATRLLFASKGELTLMNADTGEMLAPPALPEDWSVTHPDWSPDGRSIAVTYSATSGLGDKNVKGTGLARIPVNADGSFGEIEVLLPSMDERDDTLFFPSYSPDSRWIAFVRADGGSKDEESAQLFLLPASGGVPVELMRLNQRVQNEDGVLEIANSMPTWAPTNRTGTFWLAFSSVRAYGNLLEADDRDQLWGAAIDLAEIGRGDPSFAAFWMPFQQLEDGNHRAFWAIDTEMECPESVEICDDLDNDCDALVDEGCCTPQPEICDNGIDDDCDGERDEGCGCMEREICGNGIDDDCDRNIDSDDEDCLI